ncbi:MAG TPA: FimV/HubP family polar landmark protein, partial [Pseudidiomarina sp.]|nr:FimV/HubP family polar landmark protein [Pseudidiomarina sp.]
HDFDLIDIETLLEEADADANDDVEDRYSTDDVKDVLGESNEPVMPSGTDLEDDFELGKSPATLLDLAQAYIEMGEMEDARILLNKIKHCGDDDIEREVAQLLQNLDGPSHR